MPKLRNIVAVVAGTVTLGGAAAWVTVRPWWHAWGTDPVESAAPLPGDDVVPDAGVSDTRAVTIDAPPSAVWPWLTQMGFGRGGWYSYDVVDMKGSSADKIIPDLPPLAPGDILPTHPGGGFEVRVVEPDRALVLYVDSSMARSWAAKDGVDLEMSVPANLRAGGAFMNAAQPTEFAASWSFVIEPLAGDRTRLIERFRIRFDGGERAWTRYTLPALGFGVFVMIRRQLLGIKARAEAASPA